MQDSQRRRIAKADEEWRKLPAEKKAELIARDAQALSSNGTSIHDPLPGDWTVKEKDE